MKIELLLCLLIVFGQTVSFANGQDTRARLEASMRSIQDDVNGAGRVSKVIHIHDVKTGKDSDLQSSTEDIIFNLDANGCELIFRRVYDTGSLNFSARFRDINELMVRTLEEDVKARHMYGTAGGNYVRVDPSLFVVAVVAIQGAEPFQNFFFKDVNLANHVAQSMADAARICQGGRDVKLTLADVSNSKSEGGGGSKSASSLPIHYQVCGWFWQEKGESGQRRHHFSAGPVIQIHSDLVNPPNHCGTDFGRWVAKNHPEIMAEDDPDSPRFIGSQDGRLRCVPKDECSSDDSYMGQQKVRQQNIEQQRSYGVEVEELGWTPPPD